MVDNALARFQPSQNNALSTSLMGIESALANAARANVTEALGDTDGYTVLELRSMETIEQLKLVNGMDLAAILLRGKLLKQIEDEALFSFHPNQYHTMQDMAREQGISLSELSNVRDLCFVLFPYMEDVLHMNVAVTFENIGKSNMRELVAVLKAIITGADTRGSVHSGVEQAMNDAAASLRAVALSEGNEDEIPEDAIRAQAVSDLLLAGEQMPNRDLRNHVRPTRTQAVDTTIINSGERRFIMAEMTEEQFLMFQRKMGSYMEPIVVNLPTEPRARRTEAARIQIMRDINSLME